MESNFHDKPIETYIEKQKNEEDISKCEKWRSLIETVVGRKIAVLIKNNYPEYGYINNAFEVSICIDKIYDVWN